MSQNDPLSIGRPANEVADEDKFPDMPAKQRLQPAPPPPAWEQDYQNWRRSPTPAYATTMLKHLQPVIDTGLKTYSTGTPSPMLRSKAKLLALQALHTYDPQKSALQTHVMTSLQRLQRLQAADTQIMRVPERHWLAFQELQRAENDLQERLLRPPTTGELADFTGISAKKIAKLRATPMPMAEGGLTSIDAESDDVSEPAVVQDTVPQTLEFVYEDLQDPKDKLIMEYGLGLHGRKRVATKELARQLKLTPGAVSQRAARIQHMIDSVTDAGLF